MKVMCNCAHEHGDITIQFSTHNSPFHQSSGSGSESGVRTQKSLKSESGERSDNKHDDEDDIGSIGLNARDKSDNGSGTQVHFCYFE